MEVKDLLGTSNEMEFECLNCGKHIPSSEDEDEERILGSVVTVERGSTVYHQPLRWWFCSMDCFTEYVLERVSEAFRGALLFDLAELRRDSHVQMEAEPPEMESPEREHL